METIKSFTNAQKLINFAKSENMSIDDLIDALSLIRSARFRDKVNSFDQRFADAEKRMSAIKPGSW